MFSKKAIAAAVLSMGFGASAFATHTPLPANCEYGRDKNYDISPFDLYDALQDGLNVYASGGSDLNAWINFLDSLASVLDGFDYLRVETPKHVLKGQSFRAKGNLFDIYANVNFYNSEFGYVGTDKSNLDANSYLNMDFQDTYGYGLVWVQRGSLCSAEGVWVQEAPVVTSASATGGYHNISGSVNFTVDQFSRAAKDSNVKARVTIVARNDIYGNITTKSYQVNGTSGTINYDMSVNSGGPYDITVQVNDGTHSKNYMGQNVWAHVTGPLIPPCPNCQAL